MTTHFQAYLFQALRGTHHDLTPNANRTGKGNFSDYWRVKQLCR
jgi:hypothetical protein